MQLEYRPEAVVAQTERRARVLDVVRCVSMAAGLTCAIKTGLPQSPLHIGGQ